MSTVTAEPVRWALAFGGPLDGTPLPLDSGTTADLERIAHEVTGDRGAFIVYRVAWFAVACEHGYASCRAGCPRVQFAAWLLDAEYDDAVRWIEGVLNGIAGWCRTVGAA